MYTYKNEERKLFSYLGDNLSDCLKNYNCIVAGGSINSIFNRKDINDIDIYFRTKEDLSGFIQEYCNDFSGFILTKTNKALLLKDANKDILVQLIYFRYFDNAEEIFNTFDFTVCMGAYDFKTDKFILHKDFLHHNTCRLLKFNENTAYPIMSALRVQKYKDKGYDISKADFIKIILACMNLDITTYEELKEQIGGMYGINIDKLFEDKFKPEDDFNLIEAINAIIDADDEYIEYKEMECIEDINVQELAYELSGCKIKYFKHKNKCIAFYGNELEVGIDESKDIYEEITIEEAFKNKTFCKWVKLTDDKRYVSHYNNDFEYKFNKITTPKEKDDSIWFTNSNKLYCCLLENCYDASYSSNSNSVLIELKVDVNDIIEFEYNGMITINKCIPTREIAKEEYEHF